MIVIKDVGLSLVILSHDNLLCPEKGSEVLIEIHFLLISNGVVTDPKFLRISFKANVN